MGWFRIFSTKDTTITNQVINNTLSTRATGSNLGAVPSLSVYAFPPDAAPSTMDLARSLIQFDLTELSGKIYSDKVIPSSSVSYYLSMFDMKHADTVPTSFDLFVYPLSRSWDEGTGIDFDNFRDHGFANWYDSTSTTSWTVSGSDFIKSGFGSGSQHFDNGQENLQVNITDIVVNWLTSSINNYGLVLKLGDTEENSLSTYYRKSFHSRESKFIDSLPFIEARWNDVQKDNRNNFAFDVTSSLYMYNFVRGELTKINESVTLRIQDSLIGGVSGSASFTSSYPTYQISDGILTASILIQHTGNTAFSSTFYDIWESSTRVYMTGNFKPLYITGSLVDPYSEFTVNVNNLKRIYSAKEDARLIVNVRKRDWVTFVGVLASGSIQLNQDQEYIEKMYYSVIDSETGNIIIPFSTGSVAYTQLSYNASGHYFDISMNSFIPGVTYEFMFLIDINTFDKKIYKNGWTFRIIE